MVVSQNAPFLTHSDTALCSPLFLDMRNPEITVCILPLGHDGYGTIITKDALKTTTVVTSFRPLDLDYSTINSTNFRAYELHSLWWIGCRLKVWHSVQVCAIQLSLNTNSTSELSLTFTVDSSLKLIHVAAGIYLCGNLSSQ